MEGRKLKAAPGLTFEMSRVYNCDTFLLGSALIPSERATRAAQAASHARQRTRGVMRMCEPMRYNA